MAVIGTTLGTIGAGAGTGICVGSGVCVVVGGAIIVSGAIYLAWPYLDVFVDITSWRNVFSRRLITVEASCGVHKIGTPDHATVGLVTGSGQGLTYQDAKASAYIDANSKVTSAYGLGFHAQHCGYRQVAP